MDEKKRKVLESLGWTPELLEIAEGARVPNEVDRMFLDGTVKALAAAGFGALEFLAANPGVSINELAERLPEPPPSKPSPGLPQWRRPRASGIGLTMVIYEEAARKGIVRETAKDLLIRKIREGWSSHGKPDRLSKMLFWDSEVSKYGHDPRIEGYVDGIVRYLAIDHPPHEGWIPEPQNDPLIDELFDRYWPVESNELPKP